MGSVSKEAILNKTHYGTNIYSHILREYYPDEVVMTITGRDCGLCRNPFNSNKETLHIWIKKTDPTNVMSSEIACHKDTQNAIATGDAFSFAELHYKQQGDKLLQTLNKELNLRIGEQRGFYNRPICPKSPVEKVVSAKIIENNQNQDNHKNQTNHSSDIGGCSFSFFKAPISNTKPHKAASLLQIYNAIKGNFYKEKTQKLRAISDVSEARKFKATNFDYCTFSGTFTSRNDKALVKHSGLLCIDFDHLNNVSTMFNRLLQDEYFDTQLLFRSPSGDGLKWIISIDTTQVTHSNYFIAVANYILQTYGVAVDKSGRDISRACFLPHDPQAYINPNLRNSL